jgi:hypothetical protein
MFGGGSKPAAGPDSQSNAAPPNTGATAPPTEPTP